jgi:HPr kinase/phosphorylase
MADGSKQPPAFVVHASAVAWHGRGVLLRGPAGAGKSSLALALLRAGAVLVADDLVAVAAEGGRLVARAPAGAPAGLIEARGLGIFRLAAARRAALALAVDLAAVAAGAGPERLPEFPRPETLLGVTLPRIALDARAPGAPARLLLALCAARAA